MSRRKVAYYYDRDVGSYSYGYGHVMKPHRIKIAHDLIAAYNMLGRMDVLRPARSSPQDMTAFHTDEYIHFLHRVTPEKAEEMTFNYNRFLVPGPDNPAFEGVFEFCSISAGGSIAAAQRISSGAADIAINWAGGLHHAKKAEAAGFCYINDIVLGILELLRTYPRVLYIDIDCHHGDGVEEAFYTTDRVMCFSVHKYGDFFPGTGTLDDKGRGKGKGYSINIPLNDGISDQAFKSIFDPILHKILEVYQPSVVVLQCGADSLAGDKLGCFNLSMQGHAHCVQLLREANVPLILLGGGGYTVKNVARLWTYETACALGIENDISPHLPWNEYFEWFGPRYRLEVPENNMDDMNLKDGHLDRVREEALRQLSDLIPAPSIGMHDVPRQNLGEHLGFKNEIHDELDRELAQHTRYLYNLQEPIQSPVDRAPFSDSEDEPDTDDERRSTRSRASSLASQHRLQKRNTYQQQRTVMSILTNTYLTISSPQNDVTLKRSLNNFGLPNMPQSRGTKRQFFQSFKSRDIVVDDVDEDGDDNTGDDEEIDLELDHISNRRRTEENDV